MENEEKALLALFAAAAAYALYRTFQGFTYWEALLPRAASIVMIVLLVIVLAIEYLNFSAEGGGGLADKFEADASGEDETTDPFGFGGDLRQYTLPGLGVELPFRVAVGGAIAGYTVLAILVGLAPSSLAFVLVYTHMAEMTRFRTVGLLVASVIVLYVFTTWLETPVFDGWVESTFLFVGVVA